MYYKAKSHKIYNMVTVQDTVICHLCPDRTSEHTWCFDCSRQNILAT